MITLGQELREERERRSISLKDISDRTKIGTRILLALETDRWELMPQKFFIKGVIKAYAEALGADPGIYLAKYDNQLQETPTLSEKDRDAGPRRTRPVPDEDLFESSDRPRRPVLKIMLVGLAVLLAAAAVYFLLIRPGSSPSQKTPEPAKAAPQAAMTQPEEAKPQEAKPAPVETGLRLELRFTANSWMHVTADGIVVMNDIQAGGTAVELRAEREFVLQTGNAGGFDYNLNGRPGRPLGGSGIVLTDIRINLANAATFLKEETPPAPNAEGR